MKKSIRVWALMAAIALISPPLLMAADEDPVEPSFTNPAQAKHAENLAENSFGEGDVEAAALENYADDTAPAQAEEEIEALVTEAALNAYATSMAVATGSAPESDEYKAAYQTAYDEATLLEQAELMGFPEYQQTYDAAWARARGEGWEDPNEIDTAFEAAVERSKAGIIADGTIPEDLYQGYYDAAFAGLVGENLAQIHAMRYEDKKGWGLIAKELGIDPKVLGLGHTKKLEMTGAEAGPEADPLEEEIKAATRRNVQTGWENGKGNTNRNNEKESQDVAVASGFDEGDDEKSNNGKSSASSNAGTSNSNSSSNSNSGNNSNSSSSANSNSNSSNNSNSNSSANSSADKSNNGKSSASSNGNSNSNSNNSSNANSNSSKEKSNNGKAVGKQ